MQPTDDGAEPAGGEEPGAKRSRGVLTDRREGSQRGANVCRHVLKLPADLVFDGLWAVRVHQAGGSCGMSCGTQCVRSHMADADGLAGGSRSGHCGGSLHLTGTDATGKSTANLLRSMQVPSGEGSGPGDECPRAVIPRSLRLKQP